MRQPGTETDQLMYEDIPLAYLSTMVEYVTSYAYESAQDLEIRRFSFGSKAKRARINCEKINMYAAVAHPSEMRPGSVLMVHQDGKDISP